MSHLSTSPMVTPTDRPVPAMVTSTSPFDAIRGEDGRWSARSLRKLMGYARWENLTPALDRAKATARNEGLDVEDSFLRSQEVSGKRGPAREDYRLTRQAAYLVAMNGDPNKPEVAAAQMYFAAKTREAELAAVGKIAQPAVGDDLDVLQGILDGIRADRRRLAAIEDAQAATAAKVAAIEGQHDWFTALGYARLHGHATDRKYLARIGQRATTLLRDQGDAPQPRQDATFGSVNTYPVSVLEIAFAEVTR